MMVRSKESTNEEKADDGLVYPARDQRTRKNKQQTETTNGESPP